METATAASQRTPFLSSLLHVSQTQSQKSGFEMGPAEQRLLLKSRLQRDVGSAGGVVCGRFVLN